MENNSVQNSTSPNNPAPKNTTPLVSLHKTFLRTVLLESPDPIRFFKTQNLKMQIDMNLNTKLWNISETEFEFQLLANIRADFQGSTVYLLNLTQVGLFSIEASTLSEQEVQKIIYSLCPNALIPYLRESISDFTQKAGFEPLLINPINLEVDFKRVVKDGKNEQFIKGEPQNPSSSNTLPLNIKPGKKNSVH
ncbi:MAG: protein-export chaperone SecB [Methylacidiphilales bacterium]|nr:protein-export chaperone SecB [Candidatus Methylacidiphilales bacterium]